MGIGKAKETATEQQKQLVVRGSQSVDNAHAQSPSRWHRLRNDLRPDTGPESGS